MLYLFQRYPCCFQMDDLLYSKDERKSLVHRLNHIGQQFQVLKVNRAYILHLCLISEQKSVRCSKIVIQMSLLGLNPFEPHTMIQKHWLKTQSYQLSMRSIQETYQMIEMTYLLFCFLLSFGDHSSFVIKPMVLIIHYK